MKEFIIIKQNTLFEKRNYQFATVSSVLLLLGVFSLGNINSVWAHEGHNSAFRQNALAVQTNRPITVSKTGQQAIGLTTQSVKTSIKQPSLRLTGEVTHADEQYAELTAPVLGTVQSLLVKEGDRVRKGQTVATLRSADANRILQDLIQQKASLHRDVTLYQSQQRLAQSTLEREKNLHQQGISPKKDVESAQQAYDAVTANQSALQQQIRLLNASARSQLAVLGLSGKTVDHAIATGNIPTVFSVSSPINGVVAQHDVTLGETVDLNKKLFTIISLQPIWIFLDVPQDKASWVKVGQSVRLTTPDGHVTTGQVDSVGSMVDETKRTLPVRIESPNTDNILKPGLFVTADVTLEQSHNQESQSGIWIPSEAVISEQGNTVVYLAQGETTFQQTKITLNRSTENQPQGGDVLITSGLYDGDRLVIHGAKQLWAQQLMSGSSAESESKDASVQLTTSDIWTDPKWMLVIGLILGGVLGGLAMRAASRRKGV